MQNPVKLVAIAHPPETQVVNRNIQVASDTIKASRHTLPKSLKSSSPVGFRNRISLTEEEAQALSPLFSLRPPVAFEPPEPISEQALFEESTLGILSSRQSTNYKGLKQFTVGPKESQNCR